MKYFAYGSNMNPQRMKDMGIIFSTRERAVLEGYRLLFNKVASRNSKAGYANIVPDHTGVVEGVLYEIDERDLEKLDKYEEYPSHYGRLKVKVKLNNYETVEAVAYVANSRMVREGLKPTRQYLSHLLKGCDLLSKEYCNKLREVETIH